MTLYYNKAPSARTRVRRHHERGSYERETIEAILDEGLVGHLAFAVDGQPYAIPMLYARNGHELYLHGSPASRLLRGAIDGVPLCLTVTLTDGLVLVRSAFRHSVNYRSVVALGAGRAITDREEKLEAMRMLVDQIVPGRSQDARGPNDVELKATTMVAMTITEASAKVRSGPPIDGEEDLGIPAWAGVLPLALAPGVAIPDEFCAAGIPDYIAAYERPRSGA